MITNNTNYPDELYNKLNEFYNNDNEFIKKNLFDYQRYVYNYMVNTNNRGILLYHGVGSGKTLTSISIAEEFRKLGKEIIIISSKTLQANYKKEIEKALKMSNVDISNDEINAIIDQYKFVTSNAKNMISSLEDKLTNLLNNNKNESKVSLEDRIIIVDEAHNLFNSISNGSKIANEFYDIIMNTKKLKLIFLTGSAIINDPFEIFIAFNMLYGPIPYNKKEYKTILPEYYSDYKKYFINGNTNTIKNENKFKNRIFGLVSYYGDMYKNKIESIKEDMKIIKKKENYPDRLPIKIEVIEMSILQNSEYKKARDLEKLETTRFLGGSVVKEKNKVSTSYRIKSRQLSNIFINPTVQLTLYNYNKYSPKLEKIFKNIIENQISLIYSNFLEYGIIAFSKILELHGYKNYLENDISNNKKTYAIFSGQQSIEERTEILKIVNSKENIHGELISILLITKSGAEGIDLKNIRSVHIMEPYWNYSLIEQIIARAVRYNSHILLPENERNVQTYIYLSDYNQQYLAKEKEKMKENIKLNKKAEKQIELTTDINIFKNAIKNQELIIQFLRLIASTSIECKFFNQEQLNYECFSCIPNNKKLFNEDIQIDLETTNNCLQTKIIKVEEIIINDEKWYYQIDENDIKLYKYNEDLQGYIPYNDEEIKTKIKHMRN